MSSIYFISTDDALAYLHCLGIDVRLNLMTQETEVVPLRRMSDVPEPDRLPNILKEHFSDATMSAIKNVLHRIAMANAYNPVKDFLAVTKWDKQDRISILTTKFMTLRQQFERDHMARWLHQTIAMALNDKKQPKKNVGVLVVIGDNEEDDFLLKRLAVYKGLYSKRTVSAYGKTLPMAWITNLCWKIPKPFTLINSVDKFKPPFDGDAYFVARRRSFCMTASMGSASNNGFLSKFKKRPDIFWVIRPIQIDEASLKGLDREWFKQLWAQVYETMYLTDLEGYRWAKPTAANSSDNSIRAISNLGDHRSIGYRLEADIRAKYNWDAPLEEWTWTKPKDVAENFKLIGLTPNAKASLVGKALTIIGQQDKRIQSKHPGNVKQYLLPPLKPTDKSRASS